MILTQSDKNQQRKARLCHDGTPFHHVVHDVKRSSLHSRARSTIIALYPCNDRDCPGWYSKGHRVLLGISKASRHIVINNSVRSADGRSHFEGEGIIYRRPDCVYVMSCWCFFAWP